MFTAAVEEVIKKMNIEAGINIKWSKTEQSKAASPYVRMWSVCLHALRKVRGSKLVLCVQMLY